MDTDDFKQRVDKDELLRALQYSVDNALVGGISTTEIKRIVDVVDKIVDARVSITGTQGR